VTAASGPNATWRLLRDGSADGAWNMAVDEALLEGYESSAEPRAPTLRLYGWIPGALSLGKSQTAAGAYDAAVLKAEGIDLVRRPTGGEAVLHEHERTYAVIGSAGEAPFAARPVETYRAIAGALVAAMQKLDIPTDSVAPERTPSPSRRGAVCFDRIGAWEIAWTGRKLIGSSQFRRRRSFLQHGSIPLRLDPARLGRVTGLTVDGTRFADLTTAAGRAISADELDHAVIAAFESAFDTALVPGVLAEAEALRAAELRCWKYDSMAWTIDGTICTRESRWGPVAAR
jgi:lipoyl(octanoyl) transferase